MIPNNTNTSPPIESKRTTSMEQPPDHKRKNALELMHQFIEDGLIDQARELDKKFNNGEYFKLHDSPIGDVAQKVLDGFLTCNAQMLELKRRIKVLAQVEDSVLIQGPSGTGKELLATALHAKRTGKFIPINCAGLPEYLIESELFGHVKGSFTGAESDTKGLIECANKGTLFLDEVGELPLPLQAKLLRVLQDKRIRKVGGKDYTPVEFRLVAATHQDLEKLVVSKLFRLDLWERMRTFELKTLSIAERPEDIPLIISSLDTIQFEKFPCDRVDWQKLIAHQLLGGNIRTLQQMVRRWQIFKELPSPM